MIGNDQFLLQKICASAGPALPDPDVDTIAQRLENVKHKILILSGKGGVGKSTVTANIARCLSTKFDKEVGVLDVDICGPSQPTILGCQGESVHQSGKMAIGFLGFPCSFDWSTQN